MPDGADRTDRAPDPAQQASFQPGGTMRVFEAMGEALKQLGVEALFGLVGGGNLSFVTYWQCSLGLPYYSARHEGGAVAMADAYARVTGRLGVATVTEGPGVTNAVTALTEAVKASTPS